MNENKTSEKNLSNKDKLMYDYRLSWMRKRK